MTNKEAQVVNKMIKQIATFNADLEEYYRVSEDDELPNVDCHIVGYDPYDPMEVKVLAHGFYAYSEGFKYTVTVKTNKDGDVEVHGWDDDSYSLKDELDYQRKRLRKAWRVWHSDHPDKELERD